MSERSEWKKLVDADILKSAAATAGSQTLAYLTMGLLIRGETLTLESLHGILTGSLERAKKDRSSEFYAEALLALSFFDRVVSEYPSGDKE